MLSDLPHTLYLKNKKDKEGKTVITQADYDKAYAKNEELIRRMRERQKSRSEGEHTLESVFNGSLETE